MKRYIHALILGVSLAGIAYWASAEGIIEARAAASCEKGVLTVRFPVPLTWIKISFAEIMRLCTVPA